MSSTLEYRHLALRIPTALALQRIQRHVPAAAAVGEGDRYLVFVEAGCSNVFSHSRSSRGRLDRRWHLAAVGTASEIAAYAEDVAERYVDGGMVCLRTRRTFTDPKRYINVWRCAVRKAVDAEAIGELRLQFLLPRSAPGCGAPWVSDYTRALVASDTIAEASTGDAEVVEVNNLRSAGDVAILYWLSLLRTEHGPLAEVSRSDRETLHNLDAIYDAHRKGKRATKREMRQRRAA